MNRVRIAQAFAVTGANVGDSDSHIESRARLGIDTQAGFTQSGFDGRLQLPGVQPAGRIRRDHYSDALWPRDYSGNWMLATNLRTGVRGWVSLDWVDWYQPTC